MSDYERRMRESLTSASEGYRPSDLYAARQEFFRRRRRRKVLAWTAAAAVAPAAAAFIAFAVLDTSDETGRRGARTITPAVSAREIDLARIGVGNGPDGIAVGEGYVWVVNAESKSLSRVDPATDAVETVNGSVGDQPEDLIVAHGSVWVTDRGTGDVYRYDLSTDEMRVAASIGSGADLDVAAGEANDLWIAEVGGELHRLDADGGRPVSWPVAEDLADVSFIDSEAWAYDEGAGEVVSFDSATEAVTTRTYVGVSDNADLVAGLRYVWFYRGSDGKLLQIERQTARVVKRIALGGTFGSLTIGEDSLWAMVTQGGPEGSGDGRLYRIDVDDAVEIQEPIPVSDTPYDLAAGYGSVWATNFTSDEVTRVDVSTGAAPEPTVAETPTGEVVFYYTDGNDVHSFDEAGGTTQLTDSPEPEVSPSITPDGETLFFQRGDSYARRPEIVARDLSTGNETVVGPGIAPAVGPDGRLAYARYGTPSDPTAVTIETSPGGDVIEVDIPGQPGPSPVDRIAWDPSGDLVYAQTIYEGTESHPYTSSLPHIAAIDLTATDPQPVVIPADDRVMISPLVVEAGTLGFIELCCGNYPEYDFTTADLSELEVGPGFEFTAPVKILGIDDVGLEPDVDLFAVPAGNLDYETDQGWTTDEVPAWLVGDGDRLYLMDAGGEKDLIPISGVEGVAVAPPSSR